MGSRVELWYGLRVIGSDCGAWGLGLAISTGVLHTLRRTAWRLLLVGAANTFLRMWIAMAEGTIKRLTDKGFGFIDTGTGKDVFFHSSNLDGVSYDELREGQRVTYNEGNGPKGPRAENVALA